jgi:predicted transcriptional regulator
MTEDEHILISLEPRHAESILEGRKTVELRRRAMNVKVGATVWIYAKRPVGSIVGCAKIRSVHLQAPSTLWRRFGPVCGISRGEFFAYFEGAVQAMALELAECRRLDSSLTLESLRHFNPRFQPPQFFARLKVGTSLMTAINSPS